MKAKKATKRGPNRLSQAQNIRNLFEKYPNKKVAEIAEIAGVKYQIAYMVRRDMMKRALKKTAEDNAQHVKAVMAELTLNKDGSITENVWEPVHVSISDTSLPVTMEPSALDVQVGGGHYKNMKIQPVKFITENNLDFLTGCIIKRICRWKEKDGLKDLEKIKHEVDLIIELNGLRQQSKGV